MEELALIGKFKTLRSNSYVEVIPHRIKLREENFSKFELNATLMRYMNPNKIKCEVRRIIWLAIPNYSTKIRLQFI